MPLNVMSQLLTHREGEVAKHPLSHYSGDRVRSALAHFLVGKFATAALAFATLIVLLRGLSIPEYGAYVGLMAARGVMNMLSSLGLDGMSARFIPELRMKATESALLRAMFGILMIWLGALASTGLILWLTPSALLATLNLGPWASDMPLFLSLVIIGGISNFASGMLNSLLLQRISQVSNLISTLARLLFVAIPMWRGNLELSDALVAELVGSAVALILALFFLLMYFLKQGKSDDGQQSISRGMLARMCKFAVLNYSAQILRQAQGPYGLRIAVASILGISASAQFGFVMSLADTIQRYLPTTLLATVIRPVLISRYVANGGFAQVNRFASVLFKINLMLVAPALVLTVVQGSALAQILGGEKYADVRWLLPAGFALLITFSHTAIVSLIADTVERNALQLWGGLFAITGLVIGIALTLPLGIFGIILGTWIGSVAYNSFAVRYLRRQGLPYQVDAVAAIRLVTAAAIGIGIPSMVGQYASPIFGLAISLIGGVVLYLYLTRLAHPFDASDLAILRQVITGRLQWVLDVLSARQDVHRTSC